MPQRRSEAFNSGGSDLAGDNAGFDVIVTLLETMPRGLARIVEDDTSLSAAIPENETEFYAQAKNF